MSYANWKIPPIPKLKVIWPSRITTLSVTLGMAIMGMLTFYFRYQRKMKKKELKARSEQSSRRNNLQLPNGGLYSNTTEVYVWWLSLTQLFKFCVLKKIIFAEILDIHGQPVGRYTESPSSLLNSLKQKSISGSVSSFGGVSSASTITHQLVDTSHMSPTQLCKLGNFVHLNNIISWKVVKIILLQ